MNKLRIAGLSFFVLLITSCAVNPVTGKRQLMFMSENQEIKIGREYDPQIVSSFGLYENKALLDLITEKGQEMGKISHRPNLEYHFRILDSPVINAFAVPGGYIYFTRGILAQFSNEAEMIGVLGHEMGHVTARHTASRQTKQQLGQLLLIGGMVASEEFRRYGEYAMQGMQLLFLSFSREDERESDRLGVEYSSKIGYDAREMANFYQVLVKMNMQREQGGIPTFLSTHPEPGDRYNSVLKDVAKWQQELNFSEWKVNEDNYLKLIDGMVYGEDPRQGYVEGNMFYHPELRFQFPFPSGWDLENSPLQVRIGPEQRNALLIFTFAKGETLEQAAGNAIKELQLNVLESRNTSVNGMPAIAVLSNQKSQDQSIQALSYFINDNGTFYVFHGVSRETDFSSFSGAFESTMRNFNKLNDPSKLNKQAQRIRINRVQRAGTLADAFKSLNVPSSKMEEYAFLNNMELTDQVPAGKLLKIPGQ
jgi:predicted Zn-dependent protease